VDAKNISELENLYFLKLGGSLITDKKVPRTPRPETLNRMANEIASAWHQRPDLKLILGHGAGSFAHVPAHKYGTRQGVSTAQDWAGFVEVWREAAALNRIVVDHLSAAGLPIIAFPPSASVTARDGQVELWHLAPIRAALQARLIPLVFGDVVFDLGRGGAILSTEDLFAHLARQLHPKAILLAGIEPGVWADYPLCKNLMPEVTPTSLANLAADIHGSEATDVTGGMLSKVEASLELVAHVPGLEVYIFSGDVMGNVERALMGNAVGTVLRAS